MSSVSKFHTGKFVPDFNVQRRLDELTAARPRIKGITIDGAGANLLDDGVSFQQENAGWVVRVSIVDLPSIIPEGHILEKNAQQWGREHRTKGGLKRLFPYEFLLDYASFALDRTRPAITFKIQLDNQFNVEKTSVYRTMFKCNGKFSRDDINDEILSGNNPQLSEWLYVAERLYEKRLNALVPKVDAIVAQDAPPFPDCYEATIASLNPGDTIVHEAMNLANRAAADFFRNHKITPVYSYCAPRAETLLVTGNPAFEENCNRTLDYIANELFSIDPHNVRVTCPMRVYNDYKSIRLIGKALDDNVLAGSIGIVQEFADKAQQNTGLHPSWRQAWQDMMDKQPRHSPFKAEPDSLTEILFDACRGTGLAAPEVSVRVILTENLRLYLAGLNVPGSRPGMEDQPVFAVSNHKDIALEMASFRMMHALSKAYPGRISMPQIAEERHESGLHFNMA